MRKIKVLQFTIAQSKGGRTQYILNAWKAINKELFRFDFVTFSAYLDFESELLEEGCNVFHLSCYYRDNPRQFIQEFSEVLRNEYDVIHIHTSYWEDTIVEELAKKFKIKKIIIHSHSTGISKAITEDEYIRKKNRHYIVRDTIDLTGITDLCACSRDAAEWLYGDRVSNDKIKILHNGIDVERYYFNQITRKQMREDLGIEDCKIVLGIVGRLVYPKNQEFIISLMPMLKKNADVMLVIVGDGELYIEMKELAKRNCVHDDVLFMGHRDDVADILQAIDIFCMPSRYEAFGIALIEAQCSNLICIVSDNVAEESCITERVHRVPLVQNEWYRCITDSILEESYRVRRNRGEISAQGYDSKKQIKELEELYAE